MKKLFLFVSVTMTFHAFTMESNHQEMFAQFQSLPVELQRIILIQSFKPTIMAHSFKLKSQLKGFNGGVNSVTFNHDSSLLACSSQTKIARLFNPLTCTEQEQPNAEQRWVRSVAFNHDGSLLASGSADGKITLWNTQSGVSREILDYEFLSSTIFNHDGSLLAVCSPQDVRLYHADSLNLQKNFPQSGYLSSVAFNHDSSVLATGSQDKEVRLYDSRSGKLIKALSGHTDDVCALAFNHDGSLLASGSDDRTIILWNAHSDKQQKKLAGHESWLRSLAFNKDSSLLASGSADNTVRLWNPRSGQLLKTLTGHTDHVASVAFNHDGSLLASGSHDRTVQLWQSDYQKVLAFLQKDASSSDLEQNREQIKLIYYLHTLLEYRKNIAHTVDVSAIKQTHSATLLAIKTASPEMAEYLDRLFTEIAQPN